MIHREASNKTLIASALVLAAAGTVSAVQAVEIEEVLITAQKRTESLQDVPISVSALSSGDLEGLQLRTSSEIAAQVPNMQISTPLGDGFPVVSLRGISMSDFSLNQSSPVAIYVDEVYKGNPALQGVQLYDLERVEVLRGPQGTLYGKNTTGGAVNFITQRAGFEQEAYITAGVGTYSRKELQGAFQTVLIDDALAMRVAGTWVESDGWKENKIPGIDDANAIDEWGGRISFAYTPRDELEFLLRVSSSDSSPVNYGITAEPGPSGVGNFMYELFGIAGELAGGTNGGNATSYTRAHLDDFDIESNRDAKREIETSAVALTVNWDLSAGLTLTSITSWDEGSFFSPEDTDGSPLQTVEADYGSDADQISQDLRLTSSFDGDFNFIAGLYYANETIDAQTTLKFFNDLDMNQDGSLDANDCLDPLLYAFGLGGVATTPAADAVNEVLPAIDPSITGLGDFATFGCQARNSFEQERSSLAGYFDGNLALNDAITLQFGLRYTTDKTELNDMESRLLDNGGSDLTDAVGFLISPTSDNFTDREWTGKIGLDYTTEHGTLFYTSLSKGYRSGAFNGQAFFDPGEVTQVDPETVNAFEAGFKSEMLDNSLQLNGAAFYYDYSNQQFLNVDPATLAQTLVNIDSSTITGFELELTARPLQQLMLRAGLGWLDTEVDKGTLGGVDVEGNELLAAPNWNANLSVDYDIDIGPYGALTLHADSSFVDEQYFDVFNTESIKGDDYWVHNARIAYESTDSRYTVALWVKNIADKVYTTQAYDLQAVFGLNYTHIGAPRTAGVAMTLRF